MKGNISLVGNFICFYWDCAVCLQIHSPAIYVTTGIATRVAWIELYYALIILLLEWCTCETGQYDVSRAQYTRKDLLFWFVEGRINDNFIKSDAIL
jgi:hypothetical protein